MIKYHTKRRLVMKISKTLIHYLSNSSNLLESNIIITNADTIIYANTYNNLLKYENIPLSDDLRQLYNKWSNYNNYDEFLILTDNFFKIHPNTNFLYKGQLFLPIFNTNKDTISGLLIFFRDNRNFVKSSLKYAKTIKHFIEIFTADDYIDKNI